MRNVKCYRTGLLSSVALLATLLCSFSASAEVAVIVHPSNAAALNETVIAKIYLGKVKKFPGGGTVLPMNQPESSERRTEFNKVALKKTSAQLKAYWSKLVFTGKGTPPKEVDGGEMKALIAANPSLIGYIDASEVDGTVKVVHTF